MTEKHLDGRAGPKINTALGVLENENDFLYNGMAAEIIQSLIKNNNLTDQDFDAFEKKLLDLPATIPENLGIDIQKTHDHSQRTLYGMFNYLALGRHLNGLVDDKIYIPATINQAIYRIEPAYIGFQYTASIAPVRFCANHTAVRYIKRTGDILDLTSESIRRSIVAAYHIAQSYGDKLLAVGSKPVGVLVPHDKGLFLGYIEGIPSSQFKMRLTTAFMEGNGVLVESLYADKVLQPYRPAAMLTLKTYYNEAMCNRYLAKLRNDLISIFAKNDATRNEQNFHYAVGSNAIPMNKPNNSADQEISDFYAELQALFHSKEWIDMQHDFTRKKHVPEKGLIQKVSEIITDQADNEKFWEDPRSAIFRPAFL